MRIACIITCINRTHIRVRVCYLYIVYAYGANMAEFIIVTRVDRGDNNIM